MHWKKPGYFRHVVVEQYQKASGDDIEKWGFESKDEAYGQSGI